jgi:hypothetical protein
MKPKIYYIVILCIIIIANGIAFIYQQKTISRLRQMPLEFEKRRVENILLKEGFFHMYDFEDISIDYSVFIHNVNGDTKRLEELFSGKNSIVLFMSVGSCNSCVYDNIKAIRDLRKTSNIMIGIDGLTVREFKAYVFRIILKKLLIVYRTDCLKASK